MPDIRPLTVLQFGETGQISRELIRQAPHQKYQVKAFGRADADFIDPRSAARIVEAAAACDAVVNAAAYTAVDKAESDEATAMAVNSEAVGALARACAMRNVPLIHLSTDYVFDGRSPTPYREDDPTDPVNVYGRSKQAGEERIRETLQQHVIVRTSWVYSPYGSNFLKTMLRLGMERDELRVVHDQFGAPTSATDIAAAIHTILWRLASAPTQHLFGTFHYAAKGETNWFDFAKAILAHGRNFYPIRARLQPIATSQYPTPAMRPKNSILDCGKIESIYDIPREPWENAVEKVILHLAENGGVP